MTAKILIVDDEPGIRNVLKISLTDAGYETLTADDGKKAAALVKENNFDIVLTDIRMPGLDGIALLKQIKKNRPDTEVIMITGHGDYRLAIESLKLDAVDFISKPIDNDVLGIALKRATDRIEARNQIRSYTRDLEIRVEEKTKKLAESEKRYIQLFNESPSYITIQDRDLNIVETNRIFKAHFDFKPGMTCHEIYKGRQAPCPECPVEKTFKDGKSHTAEMDVVLRDGSLKNIIIQTSAIQDDQGNITHVMEMSTDVTMIHELQDHLVSLGLHIGSVSHGLKQLVTGIDGGAYLVESGLKKNHSQQISDGWDIVKTKISETRDMVMNILYHAKKRKPELSPIPLSGLIDEIVSSIAGKVEQEDIELTVSKPDNDIELLIDRMAIFAAFRSLLENAVDACLATDRKGAISVRAEAGPGRIIFFIRDNGKGLPPDRKEKIFDLFYSDKGSKGTGLGLFIAARSIKQHKGSISVDSSPGEFTEFKVILPLTQ